MFWRLYRCDSGGFIFRLKDKEQSSTAILVSCAERQSNYHYENIAFVCNKEGEILRLAPMIGNHEFSLTLCFRTILRSICTGTVS